MSAAQTDLTDVDSQTPVEILIVDDRLNKLLALEAVLSSLNEKVTRATSGKEALRLLLQRDFAVMLLDVQMPGIDGFETAELVRKNERTKDLPIIFVSAFTATPQTLQRVYSLGAVDYVSTPGSPEAIRAKVAVFVELFRKNRALQKLVGHLNDKTNQLNDFCYTVAHDLRAPLRAINGFASCLKLEQSEVLNDGGKEYLDKITASASRLDRLIQDLLGYCRIEQKQVGLREVDLQKVIDAALAHLEQEIKFKKADVSIKRPMARVAGDRGALEHVFLNLISNALKFTKEGKSPRIRIYSERKAEHVRVWVEDDGIGIAPEYHQRIFGLFETLNPGLKYPGTGVGLAIVSKAVERLGGKAGVESEPNVGSRFWVELPEQARDSLMSA